MSVFKSGPAWILTSLVSLLALWVLADFLVPLVWAFIIALASWPVYRRFAARMPRRFASNLTPLVFTILISLFVLGPFGFAFVKILGQAQAWAHELAIAESQGLVAPNWLIEIPLAGSWLFKKWNLELGNPGGLTRWLQRTDSAFIVGWAGSAGQFILRHTIIILVTILGLFFLYRGGESLAGRVKQFIHDTLGERGDHYFRRVTDAVRALMGGMIIVALIDGVLIGLAYKLAHVPSAEFWGAITGLLAMIPYLAYVAVSAVSLALLTQGANGAALAVFCWGIMVAFIADKLIRPALVGHAISIGFFWILLGTLGGLKAFGLLGLFVGPLILGLAAALWRDSINASRG